jgi:sugar lactone lactonase YvrE
MDDCMLWNTSLPDGGILRAVAAQDVEGLDFTYESYVWIGGWEGIAWKLDGDDGSIVVRTPSPTNNYGFALDGNGNLWISGRGNSALGRIDTTRCLDDASCADPVCDATGDTCVKQIIPLPAGANPYGITVDVRQRVWTANHGSLNVTRYDPSAPAGSRWVAANVEQNCHGIAADAEGWVWAACWDSGIRRILGDDPTMSLFVPGTNAYSCKGMAVDFDGKIWSINRSHNSAIVVTPGPTIDAATVDTDVANMIVAPYTYSDMTGQQLRLATNPRGFYRRTFEGCPPDAVTTGTEWEELRFSADLPPGTNLVWRVRTAATRADLAAAEWILVAEVPPDTSPASIRDALAAAGVAPDQWLEVEVQLHAERGSPTEVITPRVFEIEATHSCPPSIG